MLTKKPTIYGFLNGMLPDGRFIVTAATEDGETVCSVVVRNALEGKIALGMDGLRKTRHELYKDKCPFGFRLEYVPWAATSAHEGVKKLVEAHYRNKGAVA